MKQIAITATSSIYFDQRVLRIAQALEEADYKVTIFGRIKEKEKSLIQNQTQQKSIRFIRCFFESSFLFYAEFNLRLFFTLLKNKNDIIYACDADTLLAGTIAKWFQKNKLIYDSHEYFEESPEIINKKWIQNFWFALQRFCLPSTDLRFSVSQTLCDELSHKYNHDFTLLRNVPILRQCKESQIEKENIILYQGVLNVGRGLEEMIQTMQSIDNYIFWIIGDGDLKYDLECLVDKLQLSNRVIFLGRKSPQELFEYTQKAKIGINFLTGDSKNYYYSGANKCYDYIQAHLPSIQMNFPEYVSLNNKFEIAILINDLQSTTIRSAIQRLEREDFYNKLRENCKKASLVFHWENEKQVLLVKVNNLV